VKPNRNSLYAQWNFGLLKATAGPHDWARIGIAVTSGCIRHKTSTRSPSLVGGLIFLWCIRTTFFVSAVENVRIKDENQILNQCRLERRRSSPGMDIGKGMVSILLYFENFRSFDGKLLIFRPSSGGHRWRSFLHSGGIIGRCSRCSPCLGNSSSNRKWNRPSSNLETDWAWEYPRLESERYPDANILCNPCVDHRLVFANSIIRNTWKRFCCSRSWSRYI